MSNADLVRLIEEIISMLDHMGAGMRANPARASAMPRPQISALVRLYTVGTARLKDIADRERTTAPNLCVLFRNLEQQGLITRRQDEHDRRNVWYSVTPAGEKVARDAIDTFRRGLAQMFSGLSVADAARMVTALETVNQIMKSMENMNEKN